MAKKITAAFRAYLKSRGVSERDHDSMTPLTGIQELRDVVAWADRTPEYEHDYMTPAELIARYRRLAKDGA